MAEFTHSGMVSKNGRKRLKLRKAVKNWHCENGCIFDPVSGAQTNGNRSGFLEINTLRRASSARSGGQNIFAKWLARILSVEYY